MILPTEPVVRALEFANKINEDEVRLESMPVEAGAGFFRVRTNDIMHHTGFEVRVPESKVKEFKKDFLLQTIPSSLLKSLYGVSAPELTIEKLEDGQLHLVCGRREATMHVLMPTSAHLFEKFAYEGMLPKDGPIPTVTMKSDVLSKEISGLLKAEPLSLTFQTTVGGKLSLITDSDSGKVKTTFDPSDIVSYSNLLDASSSFQLGNIKFILNALSFSESVDLFVGLNKPVMVRLVKDEAILAYMAAPYIPTI